MWAFGHRARDNAPVRRDRSIGKHLNRQLPPWLLGLIVATVFFVVLLLLANVLGFGDDPVVGGLASRG